MMLGPVALATGNPMKTAISEVVPFHFEPGCVEIDENVEKTRE